MYRIFNSFITSCNRSHTLFYKRLTNNFKLYFYIFTYTQYKNNENSVIKIDKLTYRYTRINDT